MQEGQDDGYSGGAESDDQYATAESTLGNTQAVLNSHDQQHDPSCDSSDEEVIWRGRGRTELFPVPGSRDSSPGGVDLPVQSQRHFGHVQSKTRPSVLRKNSQKAVVNQPILAAQLNHWASRILQTANRHGQSKKEGETYAGGTSLAHEEKKQKKTKKLATQTISAIRDNQAQDVQPKKSRKQRYKTVTFQLPHSVDNRKQKEKNTVKHKSKVETENTISSKSLGMEHPAMALTPDTSRADESGTHLIDAVITDMVQQKLAQILDTTAAPLSFAQAMNPKSEIPEDLVFSVPVHGTPATLYSKVSSQQNQHWPERSASSTLGNLTVKKATSVKRFKQRDGEHYIELLCDEGPSSPAKDDEYPLQWLHMQSRHSDLEEFKKMCLNAPGMSLEARFIVLQLFQKLLRTFQKQLFDGYQIEPGTVLRFDGTSPTDTDNAHLSATFVCFPYLSVGKGQHCAPEGHHNYPNRTMLQTLYPYEPTVNREHVPSFCKDLPEASESVLFVSQCWALLVGSEYIITCAEVESGELLGSFVSIVDSADDVPQVTGNWLSESRIMHETHQVTKNTIHSEDITETSIETDDPDDSINEKWAVETSKTNSMQLFEGLHVEDFLVEEDELWISDTSAESSIYPRNMNDLTSMETGSCSQEDIKASYHGVSVQHCTGRAITQTKSDIFQISESRYKCNEFLEITANEKNQETIYTIYTAKEAAEQEAAILSMLDALENPQMTLEYLDKFLQCIAYVIALWEEAPKHERRKQQEIFKRLERSIQRAELLQSMCKLESQDQAFSERVEYRDALLKALEFDNLSWGQLLRSLGDTLSDARSLFSSSIDTYTTATIERAKEVLSKRQRPSEATDDVGINQDRSGNYSDKVTAPFLARNWLNPEADQTFRLDREGCENAYAIMKSVEQSLTRRDELCYKHSPEMTLDDLDASMVTLQPEFANIHGQETSFPSTNDSYRPGLQVSTAHTYSSLRHSIGYLLAQNAVLHKKQQAVLTATIELCESTRRFVELYVPPRYGHIVCYKIWGSLSRISKSVAFAFEADPNSRPIFMVRPLTTSFIKQHKINMPRISFQKCEECREGHTYRSVSEVVSHLTTFHFTHESWLSRQASLQTTHHYFVRTENDLRNEIVNKQRLTLLTICLDYLNTLVDRAEQINMGVSEEAKDQSFYFQPSADLINCFEITALFIMQASTSIVAIEEEMRRWHHSPGKDMEELKSSTVDYALERLAELGQLAEALMTKAEEALALTNPGRNTVSTGRAGPELIITMVLQNLYQKPLLEGVRMNANQLYQKYTSKLQYQVNQFPRKRLLRDIQSLQEELTVAQLVNSHQQKSFQGLRQVLDPQSFERPSSDRVDMFPPESECLSNALKTLQLQEIELKALENRTLYLREQLKQSVEILEEDHGKAILVFTMITTIFLPLSFITSFFGMNMSDIRDIERGQGFFWAIAIPVTAAIVLGAVLLAYHGDKLYDAIVQAIHDVKERRAVRRTRREPLKARDRWHEWISTKLLFWKSRT